MPPTSFLWVSYLLEWLFFTLVRQPYRNPPSLSELGTGYVETTRESLPVNTGGVNTAATPPMARCIVTWVR